MEERLIRSATALLARHPKARAALYALDKLLVIGIAASYALLISVNLMQGSALALRLIAVPAATLALLSLVRRLIDAERPAQRYGIVPVLAADSRGRALPSRHASSAAAIACAWVAADPLLGALAWAAALLVGAVRVAGGAHSIRDVVVGWGAAAFMAVVGFALLP